MNLSIVYLEIYKMAIDFYYVRISAYDKPVIKSKMIYSQICDRIVLGEKEGEDHEQEIQSFS